MRVTVVVSVMLLLDGCASHAAAFRTCDSLADGQFYDFVRLEEPPVDARSWLRAQGLAGRSGRVYWYEDPPGNRLVCRFHSECQAETRTYQRTGNEWSEVVDRRREVICVD